MIFFHTLYITKSKTISRSLLLEEKLQVSRPKYNQKKLQIYSSPPLHPPHASRPPPQKRNKTVKKPKPTKEVEQSVLLPYY